VVEFHPGLAARLSGVLGGVPIIATGAGHDAGVLSSAGIRTAMLFVRNPTGVSHSPEEFAELDDCRAGVKALARVLTSLAA
jgi:N-carbamoyl-L-amino-acid hydrolase